MAKLLQVYIQDDNQEQLKNVDNKSRLINDLLREHFKIIDPNQMTPEQIRKLIEVRKAEEAYKKKMEEIEKKWTTKN
jgi:hypothetical protein